MDRPPDSEPRYDDYATVEGLFRRLTALPADDPRRAGVREDLVVVHLPLADHIACRYARRGVEFDDLVQISRVGLISAIDRFDPDRGSPFLAFAVPTMMGEIRRYFRDRRWAVRVPRRIKELYLLVHAARRDLAQRDDHAPSTGDLASYLNLSEEEVIEGLDAGVAFSAVSLETPVRPQEGAARLADTLGDDDRALEAVDNHESLIPLLEGVPSRERYVLHLRFVFDKTQAEIAEEIGVSQMQVSRLLSATLSRLREGLLVEE
ncbi:SigB/SigF/SigG family RNA polymerase sigma factor [Cryptosporangium phraense]|uniref:SigB/SigF/SigG family RNA polymerase sigma factor n=1 Tax=Cryptosporangium phraense TaxID=2593070 RepID=A0A545AQA0_9ACTN|nr:SigB/SigF/SigG family RNA polymerase sigma factor [Cryptosporangium phraense]